MKTISLYTRALQFYINYGYSVIPLRQNKKPLTASWKSHQSKIADEEQIKKWWDANPNANIGIVTGEISGITVIDIDTYKGGTTTLEMFPETFTVRTGNGGYHLYYNYVKGLTISANAYEKFPGLDIRNDGGFVVGPYSVTDYEDEKTQERKGGEYIIIKDLPLAPFPAHLFPKVKTRTPLTKKVGVNSGNRNASIASFIGQVLQASKEDEWETEGWQAVQVANNSYKPPLSLTELRTTFDSIATRERDHRQSLIVSPIQLEDGESITINIRRNKAGNTYKDMANVLAVLSQHPYYKHSLRYNEFRQEIEYNNKPLEDSDILKAQYFMQTAAGLEGVTLNNVEAGIFHYAQQNSYDEAKEWLAMLEWDSIPRLKTWLTNAIGVEDSEYHQGIGSQWFMGMIRRLMLPGSTFDYVLLLVGAQGIGKTSFFRILGGPWYKSYTGAMDNKDFYLAMRGAMIMDLDEGAALRVSDAIKIKSIITETHDEFRVPYGRVTKKHPRRFVFSMSTNDAQPFRDSTGNRRYWVIDAERPVDFEWLQSNRDQLFAEAYHYFKNHTPIAEVPFDKARETQEAHLPEDAWTDVVMEYLMRSNEYCQGDPEYFTTVTEVYRSMFSIEDPNLLRLDKRQEMRITGIFKSSAGLQKRRVMVDGDRKMRWMFTEERIQQLQNKQLISLKDPLEDEFSS